MFSLGISIFSNLSFHGEPNTTTYLKATSNFFTEKNYSNFSISPNEKIDGKDYYYMIPIYLNNCAPGYKFQDKYFFRKI